MTRAGRQLARVTLLLMIVQAALGRIFPGAYDDPPLIAATWIGNDWLTLLVAAPLLAITVTLPRGTGRAKLLALGVLAYAVYIYTFYLFGARLNAFLPLYVLAILAAGSGLVAELGAMLRETRAAVRPFRPRLLGGYLFIVGVVLSLVWLLLWAGHVFAGWATPVEPQAFKVVAATDLLLLAPPLLIGGSMLWRRSPNGPLIASVAAVQGALYLLVLTVNSVMLPARGLGPAPGEVAIWATLAVLTTAAAIVLVRSHDVMRNDL